MPDPYDEGWLAFTNGVPLHKFPEEYTLGSFNCNRWRAGWRDARKWELTNA